MTFPARRQELPRMNREWPLSIAFAAYVAFGCFLCCAALLVIALALQGLQ